MAAPDPNDLYRRHASLVTRWTGTELAPLAEASAATIEVWASLPMENGTFWEALNASMVEEDRARIRAIPAHVYGIHYGDTVRVVASGEGPLVAVEIIARGGYSTFRVWLGGDGCCVGWRDLTEAYAQRGCLVDVWSEQLVALACVEQLAPAIRAHLSRDGVAQRFEWELGAREE